jgi:DNA modification methylase/transcriptional regulator with XRE-family HTH domain
VSYRLDCADAYEWLKALESDSFDALLSDPPYGLQFMSKKWDAEVPPAELWREVYRVLKPGAYGLVFGSTRTWHRLAAALEDAGLELRDTLMWMYGSGFPKSQDMSKAIDQLQRGDLVRLKIRHFRELRGLSRQGLAEILGINQKYLWDWEEGGHSPSNTWWGHIVNLLNITPEEEAAFEREIIGRSDRPPGWFTSGDGHDITAPATSEAERWHGYGSALKPAYEPILLIRKPPEGTNAQNAVKHGTGALWIDGGRIATDDERFTSPTRYGQVKATSGYSSLKNDGNEYSAPPRGRFPANLLVDPESAALLDAQVGPRKSNSGKPFKRNADDKRNAYGRFEGGEAKGFYGDEGGVSRFFYCAKASRSERDAGLEAFEAKEPRPLGISSWEGQTNGSGKKMGPSTLARNIHATVKPIDLCRYLATLLLVPERDTPRRLLNPFSGSGSEIIGALLAGWDEVSGVDLEPEHVEIAHARIHYWLEQKKRSEAQPALEFTS